MTMLAFAAVVAMSTSTAAPACGVVDVHLHAYDQDPRFEHRVPNPATRTPPMAQDGASHRAATLAEAQRLKIERGVISGEPRATEQAVAESGGRLLYGEQVDGPPTPELMQRIRRLHAAGRLAYIGEIDPAYEGIALNDPRLDPLWALAEELDVPVAIHSGSGPPDQITSGHPQARARLGDPLLMEDVIARHPKLRVLMLHMGWPFSDNMVALMNNYSQVYVDTGAIDWLVPQPEFQAYLKRLIDAGFGRRILFGSDQMAWPEGIGLALQAVRASPLTAGQAQDLLHDNAVRFFRWSDVALCSAG